MMDLMAEIISSTSALASAVKIDISLTLISVIWNFIIKQMNS